MWKRRRELEARTAVEKRLFERGRRLRENAALIFPNTYFAGMSYLGFQQILKTLNEDIGLDTRRYFFEHESDPIAMEDFKHLSDFSILLISVPYENDFGNIPALLRNAGIEPDKRKRKKEPLIIIGGPALTINPHPLRNVADIFIFGDGEEKLERIFSEPERIRDDAYLEALSGIKGIKTVPGPNENIGLLETCYNERDRIPRSGIISERTFFGNMFLIEIGKGCSQRCKFCTASRIYPQVIHRDSDELNAIIETGAEQTKRIGLISPCVLDHPGIIDILRYGAEHGLEMSTSSLFLEKIESEIVDLLERNGNKSITVAVESLSEKARFFCGKTVPDRVILERADMILRSSVKILKVYLILGLPHEEDGPEEQKRLWDGLADISYSRGGEIHFSVNALVPKRYTPFAGLGFPGKEKIRRSYADFKKRFKGMKVKFEPVNDMLDQYYYSRTMEDILEKV